MKLAVEYLVIIEKKASEAFFQLCDSIEEFNRLLQKDPDIVIENNSIKYKQELNCRFTIQTGEIEDREQRFFHVKFVFTGNPQQIDEFSSLLKTVRGILHRAGAQPETLWDDLSLYYSEKAYPLIHKIENLMRKLITYFMLTNIGKEWVSETLPRVVQEVISKSKRRQYLDLLHQVDFKDLGDILFKSYEKGSVAELYDKLDNAGNLEELKLEELKGFIPKSNWERYFSPIVDCDDTYLKKRWDDLYELRCMVAHNALVTKSNYEDIVRMVTEVAEKLQKGIDNIDKIHIPEEEKEEVAENIASNLNVSYGSFIQSWKLFVVDLEKIINYFGFNVEKPRFVPTGRTLQFLYDQKVISEEMLNEYRNLVQFRNRLVHDPAISFNEQEINHYVSRLETLLDKLKELARKHSTWKDELVNALRMLGGQASLSEIYDYIEKNTLRELPETWKATVRYTLQLNSSDTETHSRGGEDLFVRLERGRWGLKEYHDQGAQDEQDNDTDDILNNNNADKGLG